MHIITKDKLEELAALEHERWAGWMQYMLDNLTFENIYRWLRQANTDYKDLPEYEKESDREEVRKVLKILGLVEEGNKNNDKR